MDEHDEIKEPIGMGDEDAFEDVSFVDSTEDGDELPTKDIVKKLREDLKICRKEKEEYLTGWQRAKADYVNLQKDSNAKYKEIRTMVTGNMVEDLLPVLDSFNMAMGNKEAWEKVDANWRNGVEYIHQQFLRVLADNNVTALDQVDVMFDPMLHESIETIPTDDESKDHKIAQVVQTGYKIGEKVIRPARVKVYQK
ncbi:MAG: molecular chaperone GrpE [Patescibacteria group bacterium]|jgi:molecular chaperone GrpE|nr:molecular chaperone GrpE [Patescibacteria group bacterium]